MSVGPFEMMTHMDTFRELMAKVEELEAGFLSDQRRIALNASREKASLQASELAAALAVGGLEFADRLRRHIHTRIRAERRALGLPTEKE